jgi:hexulose-6-phosphate isomerase
MRVTDRRGFLNASALTLTAATVGRVAAPAAASDGSPPRWRKAFMLDGPRRGPVLPVFELLKDAGFEGVELTSPNQLDRDEVLRARDQTGLVIHGVAGGRHWQDTLSDPDPTVVERGLAAVRRSLEDCKAYGGTTVLLVPAVVTRNVSYRDAYTRSQANIRKLIPDAERLGIKIAIEEVWNRFLLSPPEFVRYIDELDSPWIGAYFDVGNVVEYGFPQEWIRELGKRIVKVHVKDYGQARRFDYRLGEGDVDWQAVRQALLDAGYDGWITAEVPRKDLEGMKDVVRRMERLLKPA